jgi:glyoxylase-like metal-dependent hydrolase (beta-lactamase superfamily II)
MNIKLEDTAADVLNKAARGRGLSREDVAHRSKLPRDVVESAFDGGAIEDFAWHALAGTLQLAPAGLLALARNIYTPPKVAGDPAMQVFSMPYAVDAFVNCFLFQDPATHDAFLVDTGTDAAPQLALITRRALKLRRIFITHAHRDHVHGLDALRRETAAEVLAPRGETVPGADVFEPGTRWQLGALTLQSLPASGHSTGQTAYLLDGLGDPVLFTGDALFSGSMGGCANPQAFREQLRTTRALLETQAAGTLIAPGHGLLSTVGFERANNPFFAPPASA